MKENFRNPKPPVSKPKRSLPKLAVEITLDDALGLEAAIRRLEVAERQLGRRWVDAMKTGDVQLAARIKKDWLDTAEQLRRVSSTSPEVNRANEDSLPRLEVEQEVARMVSAFRVAAETLPRSLPPRLANQDEPTCQEVLTKAIQDILTCLHTSRW